MALLTRPADRIKAEIQRNRDALKLERNQPEIEQMWLRGRINGLRSALEMIEEGA